MGYLAKAIVASALITTIGAVAPTPDPVMVEIGINAGYDAQCAALKHGDADAWAKTIAPDFVPTMPSGKRGDAKTAHDGVATLLASTTIDTCRFVPEEVTMVDGVAVVVVAVGMSGKQKDGKSIAVEQHAVDRWAQSGNVWLQKSSTVSEQTVTIDGVVVQHLTAKGTP